MTTFTLSVDKRTAERIRLLSRREQKDETLVAEALLAWAAQQNADAESDSPEDAEDLPLEMRQQQIRALFERNAW